MNIIFLRLESINATLCITTNNLKVYINAITFMTQKIFRNALLGFKILICTLL